MIKLLQKRFALTWKGAVGLIKGVLACALQNFTFMIPTTLLYLLVSDLMNGGVPRNKAAFYIGGCIVCLLLIGVITYLQYNAIYFST